MKLSRGQTVLTLDSSDLARFWSNVDQSAGPDSCWPWLAYSDRYGVFRLQRKLVKAHRVAYFLTFGSTDLKVLHRCDNTLCCNPRHLFTGTQQDNIEDMRLKGRARNGRMAGTVFTTRRGAGFGGKVTAAQVLEIRRLATEGVRRAEIAARFGLHPVYVSAVVTGRKWKDISLKTMLSEAESCAAS